MQKTQKVAKIENREWGIVSKIQNTQARHTGEALDCLFWQERWFFGGDLALP